jgi:DNA-directed RNA polymerase specialized sigma24 family protein
MTTQYPQLSDREGYELFRSAIVERSGDAWAAIYANYRPQILGWSRQYCAHWSGDESAEDIADRALSRAWLALTAKQFDQFNSLAALLAYLRSCVAAAVIDHSRAMATRERAYQRLEVDVVVSPEQEVLQNNMRLAFWRQVFKIVTAEPERVVLKETFVLALPPRKIFARHRDLFEHVDLVYAAKRNLIGRLERNREFRRLCEELFM